MYLWGKRSERKNRRRAARVEKPVLTAFYWTGGVSNPCRVRDISRRGIYIEAEKEWFVGTLLQLVLQRPPSTEPSPEPARSFALWARIVRADPCGMGMEFIMRDASEGSEFKQFLETAIEHLV